MFIFLIFQNQISTKINYDSDTTLFERVVFAGRTPRQLLYRGTVSFNSRFIYRAN